MEKNINWTNYDDMHEFLSEYMNRFAPQIKNETIESYHKRYFKIMDKLPNKMNQEDATQFISTFNDMQKQLNETMNLENRIEKEIQNLDIVSNYWGSEKNVLNEANIYEDAIKLGFFQNEDDLETWFCNRMKHSNDELLHALLNHINN
tara:strand:+ start:303 stop:746 length:444 start_codon:yes stop_codon:yes gene_type:complete